MSDVPRATISMRRQLYRRYSAISPMNRGGFVTLKERGWYEKAVDGWLGNILGGISMISLIAVIGCIIGALNEPEFWRQMLLISSPFAIIFGICTFLEELRGRIFRKRVGLK